jgi:hypothetical protein
MEQEWDIQIFGFTILPELNKLRDKMAELFTHLFMADKIKP